MADWQSRARQDGLDDRRVHEISSLAESAEQLDHAREVDGRLLVCTFQPRREWQLLFVLESRKVLGVARDGHLGARAVLELDEQLGRILDKEAADAPLVDTNRFAARQA